MAKARRHRKQGYVKRLLKYKTKKQLITLLV
jgi:hypothetical protein